MSSGRFSEAVRARMSGSRFWVDFDLDGRLQLDEMISSRVSLDEVNDALDLMRQGEAARQLTFFD